MKRKLPYFVVININNFEVTLISSKSTVANIVGCHRNSLKEIKERTTVGEYIIIPITITK